MRSLTAVAIGRNEGDRLRICLKAALRQAASIIYVDSGSTDGSPALARSMGVEVIELDSSKPYTAARARNAGFERACSLHPELQLVQFVDADCELVDGWIARAELEFDHSETAVVFGHRRERFREDSLYNRLCDLEWDTPVGDAKACGGDALIRVAAFRQAGGFNPALIAGEEPELCVRLRRDGWKIRCIDAQMTVHDARLMRFHQWWKRSVRAGHAYAEGAWLHGLAKGHHWLRETLSIWFWGAILPLIAVSVVWIWPIAALVIAGAYAALAVRIYLRSTRPPRDAFAYALFCVIGKFPQALGQCRFQWGKLFRKPSSLIEYKAT